MKTAGASLAVTLWLCLAHWVSALDPQHAPSGRTPSEGFREHYERALRAIEREQWEAARTELLRAIELRPSHAMSHYNLGYLYMLQGHKRQAEEAFLKALSLQPQLSTAHLNLGILYDEQGQTEKAREQFESALEAEPSSAKAAFNLGAFYLRHGELDAAYGELRKVAALAPYLARAFTGLGDVYSARGEWDRAERNLRKAVAMGADAWRPHWLLGRCYVQKDELTRAIAFFTKAQKLRPMEPDIALDLAHTYQRMGRLELAEQQARRLLELRPEDPGAKELLERIQRKKAK